MKPFWDNNEFVTEPTMEDFDPEKSATTPTEAHTLLMDLFCEVENPAAVDSPWCNHTEREYQRDDCSLCQLWTRIRTYAKNSNQNTNL